MEPTNLVFFLIVCFLHDLSLAFSDHSNVPIGIHPLDEKYFASEVIRCKDGSNSFTKDRINDEFCDCVDGTDEPGTSTSPAAKFYCRISGSTPRFLFSSRVNDQICDCCDGSDEYDGSITCPNTCIMGGHSEYKTINYSSRISKFTSDRTKQNKVNLNGEDTIQKLQDCRFYAASEYAWESQTPPGITLMMLDADKMVAAASSRNPTLASALTRLQRIAFSGSWEKELYRITIVDS